MSNEQLIPNAVGRLDDVVEALKNGEWQKPFGHLRKRDKDVRAKADSYDRLSKSAKDEMGEILRFMDRCAEDDGFRERVRVACGGGAEVKNDE